MKKKVILTGDRPTGHLHLGHYVGSLANRLALQSDEAYDPFIIIADVQAFTDYYQHPEIVRQNVFEVTKDYLAVGIDPDRTTIFVQSLIPQIAELTVYFMNFVNLARLLRNPTVKAEIKSKQMGHDVKVGFATYPISQAADILFIAGEVVPVGEDQRPMIEQAREIARSFNQTYELVFPEPEGLYAEVSRLPGIYGNEKMSKSLGNAIYLSDNINELREKVMGMYTDPSHIDYRRPGKIEGNVVFTYLDAFDPDKVGLVELKESYQQGGVKDVLVKERLFEVLERFIGPIRYRRSELSKNPELIEKVLREGTQKTLGRAEQIMKKVRSAMKIHYF